MPDTPDPNQPKRLPVIGLLGGVASGKSAVADRLSHHGAAVLDADEAVGGLLSSAPVIEQIVSQVDPLAAADGAINKRILADIIFTNADKRAALEAVLHPPVIDAARQLIAHPPPGTTAIVIDAPLLLEADMDTLCDELWFVDTPREHRLERASQTRGWSAEELDRRERSQISVETKRSRADRILINDSDLDSLTRAVDTAWNAMISTR